MNFFAECLSSWGGLFTSLKVHRHVCCIRTRVGEDSFSCWGKQGGNESFCASCRFTFGMLQTDNKSALNPNRSFKILFSFSQRCWLAMCKWPTICSCFAS